MSPLEQQIADWNRENPVGTAGTLRKDFGETVRTKVTQPAYDMHGNVVAFFDGVRGCYKADRFKKFPATITAAEREKFPTADVSRRTHIINRIGLSLHLDTITRARLALLSEKLGRDPLDLASAAVAEAALEACRDDQTLDTTARQLAASLEA